MSFSDDDKRLLLLIRDLTSRKGYVTGEERFPHPIDVADVRALAADIHQSVDLAAAKRAELAAAQGHPVACHAGCAACCEQLVMIWAPEAELIADWLEAPEQAAVKQAFLEAYPTWRERSEPAIAQVLERTAANDAKGQLAALIAHWREGVMCAFNRDGMCTVYPVRPSLCRNAHAIDTSAHCKPAEGGSVAVSLHFVPLADFMRKTKTLSMAMHNALGNPPGKSEPLCTAVYERMKR